VFGQVSIQPVRCSKELTLQRDSTKATLTLWVITSERATNFLIRKQGQLTNEKLIVAVSDVIHSNGENLILGGLGSWQPMGHVDFYPNGKFSTTFRL
jgi:hypothetical protein